MSPYYTSLSPEAKKAYLQLLQQSNPDAYNKLQQGIAAYQAKQWKPPAPPKEAPKYDYPGSGSIWNTIYHIWAQASSLGGTSG